MEFDDITIILKTFERKECLESLLSSINNQNIICKILIGDDSKTPYKESIINKFCNMKIDYYVLPFDFGLSAGRNFLLEKVKTKYFLLCDDDHYFDKRTDLLMACKILEQYDLDILSGVLHTYKTVRYKRDYVIRKFQEVFCMKRIETCVGTIDRDNEKVSLHIRCKVLDDIVFADIVSNFFIAKTESVKKIGGWNEKLILSEHGEFFLRAKANGLQVGHSGLWGARHRPMRIKTFSQYRERHFDHLFFEEAGIKEWRDYYDNGNESVLKLEAGKLITEYGYSKNIKGFMRKNILKLLRKG